MKSNNFNFLLANTIFICVFAIFGCENYVEDELGENDDLSVETSQSPLYLTGARWPANLDSEKGASIRVCYKTPKAASGSQDEADRVEYVGRVREHIANSWGRVADLNFTGWGRCGRKTAGRIVVNITTSGGSSSGLGYRKSSATNMTLNMNDGRQPVVPIHEFGHALGFHHEFTRTDWDSAWLASIACTVNADCTDVNYGSSCIDGFCRETGGTELFDGKEADFDSVMASTYVRNRTNNNTGGIASPTLSLSELDILGVQELYGRKPSRSIVGWGNKCIDLHNTPGNDPSESTYLQGWDCLGNDNQDWMWIPSDHSGGDLLQTTYDRGVMDIKRGNTTNGTRLWNWVENNSSAQRWRFEDVELVGMGGLCLDVKWGNVQAGQQMWLWRCTGNFAQDWTLEKSPLIDRCPVDDMSCLLESTFNTVIRHTGGADDNLCLTAKTGSGWQPVELQPCDGRRAQRWQFFDGQIRVSPTKCLDVNSGVPTPKSMLGTYPCWVDDNARAMAAQKFHIRGEIRGRNNKCIDIHNIAPIDNGQKVQIWDCNGGTNQEWDYHF